MSQEAKQNDELDLGSLDSLDIPDADIEYQEQGDSGCESGACRL